MTHDKISFVREYCNCRRIPYRFKGSQLYINGVYFIFSVYNLSYKELIDCIDNFVIYDEYGYFDKLKRLV